MTREDAVELLEIFRRDDQGVPPLNPAALANAYLRILGSLPEDTWAEG
jgi:hypothetical protein